jgi:peptidoglycan/xylan/chitin deacetylase (PgdA/CDA1 family)
MTPVQYCAALQASARRYTEMTGQTMAPLFRAPGGKTSPALLAAAQRCGWQHVGWSDAGFLGDELPSDRYPNSDLLVKALRNIRSGDVLMAHLGIWSRQDAWAPTVLEPLLVGLKQRGYCFSTLASHPQYRAAVAAGPAPTSP